MGKCVPGMPCYQGNDVKVYTTYPKGCTTSTPSPYTFPLSSDDLYYAGPNLSYTGIQTEDTITVVLQKLDEYFKPESIFDLFITAINNDPALKAILCTKISECP